MEKFTKFIKDIFWTFIFISIWGIVGGLGLFMTVIFTFYAYLWAIFLTGFFSLFHFSDLKNFFIQKNWLAFFGRLVCLHILSSAICGYIAFGSGLLWVEFNRFVSTVLIGSLIFSYIFVAFWTIVIKFFAETRFYKNVRKTIEGLHVLGVLWRN